MFFLTNNIYDYMMTIYYHKEVTMTTPLFDAKAHFSEYVILAENGETVEITKHGKTTAVIIGLKEYNELKCAFASKSGVVIVISL